MAIGEKSLKCINSGTTMANGFSIEVDYGFILSGDMVHLAKSPCLPDLRTVFCKYNLALPFCLENHTHKVS